jgi:hypothetical protein
MENGKQTLEKQVRKTFEPHQKAEPSPLAEIAFHPSFWNDAPNNPTRRENIANFLCNDSAVRLHVPGFKSFLVKSIETQKERNGSWLLCALKATNRQNEEMGWAYLVNPEEIMQGNLRVLRNSDRYVIREFKIHFPVTNSDEAGTKQANLGSMLTKEIKSLAFMDKKVF